MKEQRQIANIKPKDIGNVFEGLRRFLGEVIFEGPITFVVLPRQKTGTFAAADATPSVLNIEKWMAGNTGANNITFFDDGLDGQTIRVLGDGFTTVVNSATLVTNTGANKLLAANKVYVFTYLSGVWYEDA